MTYPDEGHDRLRIAIVAPPWLTVPPDGYGGTELVLDRLAVGLRRLGHEVLLVAHPDSTCPVERISTPRLPDAVPIGVAAFELRHALQAYRLLADREIDVVHDHTLAGPLLGPDIVNVPVVTTNHGPFDAHVMQLYCEIAQRAPVIAISHSQAASAMGLRPLAVIHHGIDVDSLPLGEGRGGYLVALGRMDPSKGIGAAIDVARRAGLPLRIAAKMREQHERDYFDAHVRPKLGGDIEYLGELGATDKYALLADGIALLNPIQWPEPFGMVMIEAMGCGTPAVSFPCGAAREIIDDGVSGILCDSVDDMVEAAQRAASLDRAATRRHVETEFSTELMAARHVAAYRRVIGAREAVRLHRGRAVLQPRRLRPAALTR